MARVSWVGSPSETSAETFQTQDRSDPMLGARFMSEETVEGASSGAKKAEEAKEVGGRGVQGQRARFQIPSRVPEVAQREER